MSHCVHQTPHWTFPSGSTERLVRVSIRACVDLRIEANVGASKVPWCSGWHGQPRPHEVDPDQVDPWAPDQKPISRQRISVFKSI